MRFNTPGLMIPKIYDEIKGLVPARNIGDVPRAAERVLRKIETLSSLVKDAGGDETHLPTDVIQAVFRALHLSTQEKKEVLPYLAADVRVTITVIRE